MFQTGRLILFTVVFLLGFMDTIQYGIKEKLPKTDVPTDMVGFTSTESFEIEEEIEDTEGETDGNSCFLMSSVTGIKAVYICEDGNVWAAAIQQVDDSCVYQRNVTDPSGDTDVKEASINCIQGKEWLEDLIKNSIIYGIPDGMLFELGANKSSVE